MNTQNRMTIKTIWPYAIWTLTALFYFLEFLLQVSPNVMVKELMHDFNINAISLTNLVAIYFYAYAGMQIPVGILLDRLGSRLSLTIAAAICGLGCLAFSFAPTWEIAEASRFFIALGSSFAIVGCMNLAAHWFPPKRFAFIVGLTVTIGMMGAVSGEAPLSFLVSYVGWRRTFLIFAIVGMILSILMGIIVRNHPDSYKKPIMVAKTPLLLGLKTVLANPQTWIGAIYGGLIFAPTSIFGGLWGVSYLVNVHHFTKHLAAFITSFLFIGWAVGCPTFGFLSDYFHRRKLPIALGTLGALLSISAVLYLPNLSEMSVIILLFIFGVCSSAMVLVFSLIRELNPAQYNATTLSFVNMVNMVGAAIAPPITGWILEHYWTGTLVNNVHTYTKHAYHLSLLLLPIAVFIGLIMLPFLRETFCIPVEPFHHDD